MSEQAEGRPPMRVRREPPPFRRVEVVRVSHPTGSVVRVIVDGPDLDELIVDEPAASIRLLLPSMPGSALLIPSWNGNEFLFEDGSRPVIRTFTPIRSPGDRSALTLDIVTHEGGAASGWAVGAAIGDQAAISGPGRGYTPDPGASAFLLTGDESAMPAIAQLVSALAPRWPVHVGIEVRSPGAIRDFESGRAVAVEWRALPAGDAPGSEQLAFIESASIGRGTKIWGAGEASAMQRIRQHLFKIRGIDRSDTMIRGYWKRPR